MGLRNFFAKLFAEPVYTNPLATKRRLLSDTLAAMDHKQRCITLDSLATTDPDLYESWMLVPYPGRGD